jgi:hypothetical protein
MKLDITKFAHHYDGFKYYETKSSFEEFWRDCPRGDWMLWIAYNLGVDDRTLKRANVLCANTVRHLMPEISRRVVDDTLRYADGEISRDELYRHKHKAFQVKFDNTYLNSDETYAVRQAVNAAFATAYSDDWRPVISWVDTPRNGDVAGHAADAARYSAKAAYLYIAKASALIRDVIYHVAYDHKATTDSAAAEAAAARDANRRQTADICRQILTDAIFEKVKQTPRKHTNKTTQK